MGINNIEIDNEEDFDEDEYERKSDAMNEMFPCLPFSPCVDHLDKLDDILVKNTIAVVYVDCGCYCFGNVFTDENEYVKPKRAIVINSYGRYITYRDFYEKMNDIEVSQYFPTCNHDLLEFLCVNDDFVITMSCGS